MRLVVDKKVKHLKKKKMINQSGGVFTTTTWSSYTIYYKPDKQRLRRRIWSMRRRCFWFLSISLTC